MRVTSPHSWCAPISGQEAAENARYVLDLLAGTLTSEDRHRQTPIAAVDWFNNRRLLQPIGNIPPAEAEARYYAMINEQKLAA